MRVERHPFFKQEGANIHTDAFITVTQAIFGCRTKVETLYGMVDVDIPAGTKEGAEFEIEGHGLPKLG